MRFFSKEITTDKIAESLVGFFDADYDSLVTADIFKDQQISINKEQNKELIVVPMFAIIRAVIATFGDTLKTKHILGKFQYDILNKHFKDAEERSQFSELFSKRCDEYSEILNPENKDLAIQFGQIFCTHFFDKEEDGSHLVVMLLVGMMFAEQMIAGKKFLDEVSSHYEII
ncbi:MAG: hypothetical protein Greene07147_88 [Parcubacteria group bacterium Greene0714_7]|nr:MAG: hypothetical protein Greene07147_88 [Parcubacteria group bacterium Greene0714_7]